MCSFAGDPHPVSVSFPLVAAIGPPFQCTALPCWHPEPQSKNKLDSLFQGVDSERFPYKSRSRSRALRLLFASRYRLRAWLRALPGNRAKAVPVTPRAVGARTLIQPYERAIRRG